jgi:hypothetical protein
MSQFQHKIIRQGYSYKTLTKASSNRKCHTTMYLTKQSLRLYHRINVNTLRTGDANLHFLRFCITTVKDRLRKFAF